MHLVYSFYVFVTMLYETFFHLGGKNIYVTYSKNERFRIRTHVLNLSLNIATFRTNSED